MVSLSVHMVTPRKTLKTQMGLVMLIYNMSSILETSFMWQGLHKKPQCMYKTSPIEEGHVNNLTIYIFQLVLIEWNCVL